MRSINQLSALVVAALLLGVSATNGATQVNRGTNGSDGLDAIPDAAAAHIEQGDLLVGEQEYGKARGEYRAAVELIRAEDGFPGVPIRRIASSYYFEGKYQHAIAVLDRLADEAADIGDVVTQTWALADAAWILGKDCFRNNRPGAKLEIARRVKQVERLLESPNLPADEGAQIKEQRCEGCHSVDQERRSELTCYPSDPR